MLSPIFEKSDSKDISELIDLINKYNADINKINKYSKDIVVEVNDKLKKIPKAKKVEVENEIVENDVKKPKKEKIPSAVRKIVWNTYIGKDNSTGKCLCCNSEDISITNFECGHIKSEKNGGEVNIENLRPICGNCNKSIGRNNMDEFMNKYKIKIPSNWNYMPQNYPNDESLNKPVKYYNCEYCNKQYNRLDNFNRHMKTYCKKKKNIIQENFILKEKLEKFENIEQEYIILKENFENIEQENIILKEKFEKFENIESELIKLKTQIKILMTNNIKLIQKH